MKRALGILVWLAAAVPVCAGTRDCLKCTGTGWVDCPVCRHQGVVWCSACAANGVQCPRCKGTGHDRCPGCSVSASAAEPAGTADARARLLGDPWSAAVKVGAKLLLIEDDTLRLATDLPHKQAHEFFKLACDVRSGFRKLLRVLEKEALWRGRCTVYLFKDRETYVKFALDVDGLPEMARTGAYTRPTRNNPLVVITRDPLGDDEVYRAALHELAHVHLELYRSDVEMPAWLSEGMAQRFEFRYKPRESRGGESRKLVKTAFSAEVRPKLEDVIWRRLDPADEVGYAMAWSVTSYLAQQHNLKSLVDLLKDGAPQQEAFEKVFGAPLGKLEEGWWRYVMRKY